MSASGHYSVCDGRYLVTLEIFSGDASTAMIVSAAKDVCHWGEYVCSHDIDVGQMAEDLLYIFASSDADYQWAVDLRTITVKNTRTNVSGTCRWNK